ncbi:16475_t:CDS:2 [Dentiscutata erythropus]|uniref:16475_t:CDS:1 n=1 Tax=Dentiscutata erythropus TaxID=1348616 RepID=A0A9N9FAL7_9GLOM|nr:16475_t:CDS:2 [Dentiscutata erythropus]
MTSEISHNITQNLFRTSLEKSINNEVIELYDYSKFSNIQYIGSGTFGKKL